MKAISSLLEKKFGMGPAARPGLPSEEPTRTKRLLDRFFALPDSAVILAILGLALLVSLALPERASNVFRAVAYLYHLLGQALG